MARGLVTEKKFWTRHPVRFAALTLVALVALALISCYALGVDGHWLSQTSRTGVPTIAGRISQWLQSWNAARIAGAIATFKTMPWALPAVIFGFVLLSLVLMPITAMMLGIALSFPPLEAFVLIYCAALLSSLAMYGIGRWVSDHRAHFFNRPAIKKVGERMRSGGFWAVALVRMAPFAPFMLVCVAAGGFRVRFADYAIGSLIGLLPSILVVTIFANSAGRLIESRADIWRGCGILILLLFVMKLATFVFRRWRQRETTGSSPA